MRRIFFFMVLAIVVASVACWIDNPDPPGDGGTAAEEHHRPQQAGWRRTVDGWERSEAWLVSDKSPAESPQDKSVGARTHPLALALVELLVSLAALAAFSPAARGNIRPSCQDH